MDSLNKSEQEELDKRLKILWTYNSNAIEGSSKTLEETASIIGDELLRNKYENSQVPSSETKDSK